MSVISVGKITIKIDGGTKQLVNQNVNTTTLPLDAHLDGLGNLTRFGIYSRNLEIQRQQTNKSVIPYGDIRGFYYQTLNGTTYLSGARELITKLIVYTTMGAITVIDLDINNSKIQNYITSYDLETVKKTLYKLPFNYIIGTVSFNSPKTIINGSYYSIELPARITIINPVKFDINELAFNQTLIDINGLDVLNMSFDTNNQVAGNAFYIGYDNTVPQNSDDLVISMKQGSDVIDLSIINTEYGALLRCQKRTPLIQLIGDCLVDRLSGHNNIVIKIANNKCHVSHGFGPFITYNIPLSGIYTVTKVVLRSNLVHTFSVFSLPDNRLLDCINNNVDYGDNGFRCKEFKKLNYCAWYPTYSTLNMDCKSQPIRASCINGICVKDINGDMTMTECLNVCGDIIAPKYSCNNGTCTEDPYGTMTLAECTNSCTIPKYYSCNNGICSENPNGTMTLADCTNSCIDTRPRYKCNNGICSADVNGNLLSCDSCVLPKYYSCNNGVCTEDINGSMTLAECTNSCIDTRPRYKCISGVCSEDPNGTLLNCDSCDNVSIKKYSCTDGVCTEDPNGTLLNCDSCTPTSNTKWYLLLIFIVIIIILAVVYFNKKPSNTKTEPDI